MYLLLSLLHGHFLDTFTIEVAGSINTRVVELVCDVVVCEIALVLGRVP